MKNFVDTHEKLFAGHKNATMVIRSKHEETLPTEVDSFYIFHDPVFTFPPKVIQAKKGDKINWEEHEGAVWVSCQPDGWVLVKSDDKPHWAHQDTLFLVRDCGQNEFKASIHFGEWRYGQGNIIANGITHWKPIFK